MKEPNRRAVPRYPVSLAAMIGHNDQMEPCQVRDISIAGACIELLDKKEAGTVFPVHFDFSSLIPNVLFSLPAMVMWSQEGEHGMFRHGLFFTEVDDKHLQALVRVISRLPELSPEN